MTLFKFFFIFFGICAFGCLAQTPEINKNAYNNYAIILAKQTTSTITIDGELNELDWETTPLATNFFQHFPYDTGFANTQTEVRIIYDNSKIYIGAICYDNNPEKPYVNPSLRRDFSDLSDNFMVYIDFFGDQTTGFAFGVSPWGVEREGLISSGGSINYDWDNVWFSAVKQVNGAYIVEMAIPFASVRLPKILTDARINFSRQNQKTNERSTFVPINRAFSVSTLAFSAKLQFENALKLSPGNFSIIPYTTGNLTNDFTRNTDKLSTKFGFGADAKLAVSSSLNLDFTVNPDFSQVEVDRQVTNLSRFELFFPERRQFFLENADLFSNFGFSRIRPFFSRRIGVATDPFTRQFKEAPIYYGLRLSGRIDEDWRIGVMNLQAAGDQSIQLDATNYAVAAVQKQFGRSNLAAIIVNKQVFMDENGHFAINSANFNRVIGVDYNQLSKNNKWRGKYFFHKLLTPTDASDQFAHAVYQAYNDQNWYFEYNHEIIGKNYQPEVGFVPRNNIIRLEHAAGRQFYPKNNKFVNKHGLNIRSDYYGQKVDFQFLDFRLQSTYTVDFQNSASIFVRHVFEEVYLNNPFDPSNTNQPKLPAGESYAFGSAIIGYSSDRRKNFNGSISLDIGNYFNGSRVSVSSNAIFRLMPYGLVSLDFSFNQLEFPHIEKPLNLYLIGPGVDWAFNKKLFLKVVAQYNNQINNINSNIRLQWRYRPVSDFFLVYSDNYDTQNWFVRNRGLVVKWVYWLNRV